MDFLALAQHCAPVVHPDTLFAVVKVESAFNPLAIHINNAAQLPSPPATKTEAIAAAQKLQEAGVSFDVGLGQINNANLEKFGISLEQAFDPCVNIALSAHILASNFETAAQETQDTQAALQRALSLYNTGNQQNGFDNGYVQRVMNHAPVVPALDAQAPLTPPLRMKIQMPSPPKSWDVFGESAYNQRNDTSSIMALP